MRRNPMQQGQRSGQSSVLFGLLLVAGTSVVILWAMNSPLIWEVVESDVSAAEWGLFGVLGILGVAGLVVALRSLADIFRVFGKVVLLFLLATAAIACVAIWRGEKPGSPKEAATIGQSIGSEAIEQLKNWLNVFGKQNSEGDKK